jgi:hypothetical protein
LRASLLASLQTLVYVPVDIADQPVLYSEPEAYAPAYAYRGDHRFFALRLASQHMLSFGVGLGRFSTV